MKEIRMPVLVYSRIVGYYSPTIVWHKGKLDEFANRKTYKIPEDLNESGAFTESGGSIQKSR